jgi:cobalt/nickel transport system permease protein
MSEVACDCALADEPEGFVASLDPRTRVLSAAILIGAIVALRDLWLVAVSLAIAVAGLSLARLPFSALLHRLRHVEGFMIVLFVLLPFTVPGHPLVEVGPLAASQEGTLRAATIALKANASILVLFALVASMEPTRLGRALSGLGVPQSMVQLFLLTVRYIAVFQDERRRLTEAMRARAFVARSNWHTWRSLGNLAGMALVRALDRAERVSEAMRCRGFSGRIVIVGSTRPQLKDALFASAVALIALGLLLAQYAL